MPFGVRTDKDGVPRRAELIPISPQTRKILLARHHRPREAERLRPVREIGSDNHSRRKRSPACGRAQKLHGLLSRESIGCDGPCRQLSLCTRPGRLGDEAAGRNGAVTPGRQPGLHMADSLCRRFEAEPCFLQRPSQIVGARGKRMGARGSAPRPSPAT